MILADTIKGWGLPLAGDPLNHTALLPPRPSSTSCATALGVAPGDEWARFARGQRRGAR